MTKIVCISGKAGHGKDTVADMIKWRLEDRGERVLVTHFGDLVKYVCTAFFGWDGKKDEAGRSLLQYVGTDKVRAQSPDYWANFVVGIIEMFPNEWDYVLIPDCRFPNEYEIFKEFGYNITLVRVERPWFDSGLTPTQLAHQSETLLDTADFDWYILNNSNLEDLAKNVDVFIQCAL